ncbi:MAG: hypothetical protein ABL857_09245 [Rickettsiales bacterium]
MKSPADILLPLQVQQQTHDEWAHRDILNLDTHNRLKHMILHFLKYAGKIAIARENDDKHALHTTLIDAFIICLATANALNVSIGKHIDIKAQDLEDLVSKLANVSNQHDPYLDALLNIATLAGQMAKSIESTDHLEKGDPRSTMEVLIVQLTIALLSSLGKFPENLSFEIKNRWLSIEKKSIFYEGIQ